MCTLVKKKKLLAFSFANFKITRWSTGKQWGSLKDPTSKSELHWPKKVPPHFFKIQVEQARSFFFGGV